MVIHADATGEFGNLGAPVEDDGIGLDGQCSALEVNAAGDGGRFVAAGDINSVAGEDDVVLGDVDAALPPNLQRDDADLRVLGTNFAVASLDVDVAVEDIAAGVDVEVVGIG